MPHGSLIVAARTSVASLRANPVRALLATLGVVIGSAALVAILSVSDGVEQYARSQVAREGFDRLVVRPITFDTVDGQRVDRTSVATLGTAELASVTSTLLDGENAILAIHQIALTDIGPRSRAVAVRGVAMARPDTLGLSLIAGRHLSPEESRASGDAVVVGAELARVMLGGATGTRPVSEALGVPLRVGELSFEVVGVVADPVTGRRAPLTVIAPLQAAERMAGSRGASSPRLLTISAGRAEEVIAMRHRLEGWLTRLDANWKQSYQIQARAETQLDQVRKGLLVFRLFMGSVTGITLIVGGIGIMNVLLASVAERTREIGVRKAVGARRRDILMQFLAESVTITGVGSAIGTALGLLGAYGVTALMRAQAHAVVYAATTPQTLLISAALAVLVGVAFGCYPAARAARLLPIEAIHTE